MEDQTMQAGDQDMDLEGVQRYHVPGRLPGHTRWRWMKQLLLRMMQVYTREQTIFNTATAAVLTRTVTRERDLEARVQQLAVEHAQISEQLKNLQVLGLEMKSFLEERREAIVPADEQRLNQEILATSVGNMAFDWDKRALHNARYFIASGKWQSEEKFDQSGQAALDEFILRRVRLVHEAAALEIGCGIGRLLKPLGARISDVHGVDISGEMIRQGKNRLHEYPHIHLHHTDGSLDMFPDNRFDFCFSVIVFQHIPEKKHIFRYFEEVSRVLKPAGIFRFQVDGRAQDAGRAQKGTTWDGVVFSEAEITAVLPTYGFEILEMWGQESHYYWITARRLAKSDIPATLLVQCAPRRLQAQPIERFLARLCPDKTQIWSQQLMSGAVSVRQLAESFLDQTQGMSSGDFVREAYRTFFNRPPEREPMDYYSEGLQHGLMQRNDLLDELVSSAEFFELITEEGEKRL